MLKSKKLDQFYTNLIISNKLVKIVKDILPIQFQNNFLEPSIGTDNFIKLLKNNGVKSKKIQAYDIAPKSKKIIKKIILI